MAVFDSVLTDSYISTLITASSLHFASRPMATGSSTNLQQFLESVPSPITLLLVELSPALHALRRAAEIFSWKAHWSESWLMLTAWWAACLLTYCFLKWVRNLDSCFLCRRYVSGTCYLWCWYYRPFGPTFIPLLVNGWSSRPQQKKLSPTHYPMLTLSVHYFHLSQDLRSHCEASRSHCVSLPSFISLMSS
jgi:hypothetical protein